MKEARTCEKTPDSGDHRSLAFGSVLGIVLGVSLKLAPGREREASMSNCSLLAVGLAASIIALSIQPGEAATRKGKGPFAPVQDKPGLPRVLLIGDSISIGYTVPVRRLLEGKANVHRAPTNCGPTTRGLAQLDKWLGDDKWDVIHFNWGLHDLKYMDDKGRLVPVEKGHQQVPIEQYAKNLEELVKRLKKTGAKLIWASTTPVPEGATGRVKGDEVRYNAAARKIMEKYGVAIDDLYAAALPRLAEIQRPKNVHFTPQGSEFLAKHVAESILEALGQSEKKN